MSSADTSLSTMSNTKSGGIFRDFDQTDVFKECVEAVLSVDTENFVLRFNDGSAECALDVNIEGIKEILEPEVRDVPHAVLVRVHKAWSNFSSQPSGSTRTKWMYVGSFAM